MVLQCPSWMVSICPCRWFRVRSAPRLRARLTSTPTVCPGCTTCTKLAADTMLKAPLKSPAQLPPMGPTLAARAHAKLISMATKVSVWKSRLGTRISRSEPSSANSANCCSGDHDTAATCPSSGVQDYSYFSESRLLSFKLSGTDVVMQRITAPTRTPTLTTSPPALRYGPALLLWLPITPLPSALEDLVTFMAGRGHNLDTRLHQVLSSYP